MIANLVGVSSFESRIMNLHCIVPLALVFLLVPGSASYASITLDDSNSGWFTEYGTSAKRGGFTTVFVGHTLRGAFPTGSDQDLPQELRGFVVFDLSSIAGSFTSASLLVELSSVQGPDPSETIQFFDVSTTDSDLARNFGGNSSSPNPRAVEIFDDLGSGAVYNNGFSFSASDIGTLLEVDLSSSAIADINDSVGGKFGVGFKTTSIAPDPVVQEGLLFGDLQTRLPSTLQLVLHQGTVPEPTSIVVWGGIGSLVRLCVRPKRSAV